MQDSRIKILRGHLPFRIAPTERAFLQPSPADRSSERGRFRIGDSDTEAGELAQSFAQIYEKIRHFSKFYADYFSSAIGDPNSNPQKHLAELLAGSPYSPSAKGLRELRRTAPRRTGRQHFCRHRTAVSGCRHETSTGYFRAGTLKFALRNAASGAPKPVPEPHSRRLETRCRPPNAIPRRHPAGPDGSNRKPIRGSAAT